MQSISAVLAELTAQARRRPVVASTDNYVPYGSRWVPGDVGDPECPECKGLGYLRLDLQPGQPHFGELFVCDCAAARVASVEARRLASASMLAPEDLALTWAGIVQTPGISAAVQAVKATLQRGYGWVYLWGPPGPGKTLVLKTAVAETLRARKPAVMAMWADVLDHLRAGYNDQTYDERIQAWRSTPLLAVDEYARAKESDWVAEARAKVFNPRYESAASHKRTVTLFASNFAPEKGEDWFADRILDGRFTVVEVTGPSMRPLMEAE